MVFYSCARQSVRDSLMVYRSGLLTLNYFASFDLLTIRYSYDTNVLDRRFPRIWTRRKFGRIDRFDRSVGRHSTFGRWKISVENAWILKGVQAEGAGRQAGRGLYPVEEQTTTPTHPKISSPEWLKPNTGRHAYRPTPLYFHFQSVSLPPILLPNLFFVRDTLLPLSFVPEKRRGLKFSRPLASISLRPPLAKERGKADIFIIYNGNEASNSPAVIRIITRWWNYKVACDSGMPGLIAASSSRNRYAP